MSKCVIVDDLSLYGIFKLKILLFKFMFFDFQIILCSSLAFLRYRSKVLSRWLAGLPLQLAHLGSRNPELSTQLIDIIQTAAARAHKELLKSLQATALRIYGKSLFNCIDDRWYTLI